MLFAIKAEVSDLPPLAPLARHQRGNVMTAF